MARTSPLGTAMLPYLHLLTPPERQETYRATMERWDKTDWPARPTVHRDDGKVELGDEWGTKARSRRLTRAYERMFRAALLGVDDPDAWILFLSDDLEFHPRIAFYTRAWAPLVDPRSTMATLFNPSLRTIPGRRAGPRAVAADPAGFDGLQALLLRRRALAHAMEAWEKVPASLPAARLPHRPPRHDLGAQTVNGPARRDRFGLGGAHPAGPGLQGGLGPERGDGASLVSGFQSS